MCKVKVGKIKKNIEGVYDKPEWTSLTRSWNVQLSSCAITYATRLLMEPIGSIHLVCHRMLIVYESSVCAACDTVVLYGVAKICSQRYMVTSSNLVGLGTSSLTTLAFRLLNATVLNTKLLTITVMGVDCLLRGSLKRASQKTFPTLGGGNVLQCFKVGLY